MKKIDSETVQRILDTAQIVDVVSDFVTLKRRGSGYIGLCPFHNERTPSFSVSPAKGICKCFSCGKGGSPVNFIMELEQLTFSEALRYLANKYGIPIKEDEMTPEEEQAENDRASMFAINEFALRHFEHNMLDTDEGRAIGLSYFRERGINDAMIKRFHLGYAIDRSDDLYMTALRKGYSEKFLLQTGLCLKSERDGRVADRFRGRVIFPVHTVSGKVVAFGGRVLQSGKSMAKYVNSPESAIYKKNQQLYGLYQARQAIAKKNRCILVEGYMDVISMHQSGVENVVASSGTSLTTGQISLIHRFTDNVTVIYDSDAAGIKASLRGIDMLLAEGLNIKVLLLPEGDDPDSFAQHHTAAELEEYLENHQTDFISFKTEILLKDSGNDPLARARVINDVVRSISVIPDNVVRDSYVQSCARTLSVDETVLNRQVAKFVSDRLEKEAKERLRAQNRIAAGLDKPEGDSEAQSAAETQTISEDILQLGQTSINKESSRDARQVALVKPFELQLLRYMMRYGLADFCNTVDDNGNTMSLNLIDALRMELEADDMQFSVPDHQYIYEYILDERYSDRCEAAIERGLAAINAEMDAEQRKRMDAMADTIVDMDSFKAAELKLKDEIAAERQRRISELKKRYMQSVLVSSQDDLVRRYANELIPDKYKLSKVHTKYAQIETEEDRLTDVVPRALAEWRDAILRCRLENLRSELSSLDPANPESKQRLNAIMKDMGQIMKMRSEFAKYMGDRVIAQR